MNTQAGFILKIFFVSTLLSILIKYGGQSLALEPTKINVLGIVVLPSVIVVLTLGWQYINKTTID